MGKIFDEFLRNQSGAVAVDWVVLSAAIVGLGVSSVAAVRTGVGSLASETQSALSNTTVVSLGDLTGLVAQFSDGLIVSAEWMQEQYDKLKDGDPDDAYAAMKYAINDAEAALKHGNYEDAAKLIDYAAVSAQAYIDITGEEISGFDAYHSKLTDTYLEATTKPDIIVKPEK